MKESVKKVVTYAIRFYFIGTNVAEGVKSGMYYSQGYDNNTIEKLHEIRTEECSPLAKMLLDVDHSVSFFGAKAAEKTYDVINWFEN